MFALSSFSREAHPLRRSDLNLNMVIGTNDNRSKVEALQTLVDFLKHGNDPAIESVEKCFHGTLPHLTLRALGVTVKFTADTGVKEEDAMLLKKNLEYFPLAKSLALIIANALLGNGVRVPLYIIANLAVFFLEVCSSLDHVNCSSPDPYALSASPRTWSMWSNHR